MRVKFRMEFLLVAIILACTGSWGAIELFKGESLVWWAPVILFAAFLIFCIAQTVLWFLWERRN